MYAVVDIETTGGYASSGRMTEIAIYVHDGMQITEQFHSLINPEVPIPRYIQALTGITPEMVDQAPTFDQIAQQVFHMLQHQIFVAHNVNFDFSFIKHQLQDCGYSLNTKKLCTVRLSRKVFPGFPSYSLGNLCKSLQIPLENRHRAQGDAQATVKLFERLLAADQNGFIALALHARSGEKWLPLHLNRETIDQLPQAPGIYYFLNQKRKVVYVGKAKNIRKRVTSHFTGNTPRKQRQEFLRQIFHIEHEVCGSEFIALLKESIEIRRLWPIYNAAQKRLAFPFGLYRFEDQNGYVRIAVEKRRKHTRPLQTFYTLTQAHQFIRNLVAEHALCPKLCFIQTDGEPCEGVLSDNCFGACEKRESAIDYNTRVEQALCKMQEEQPTYAILEPGRVPHEQACVLMEQGRFYGMGYVPRSAPLAEVAVVKSFLTPYPENETLTQIIQNYPSDQVVTF